MPASRGQPHQPDMLAVENNVSRELLGEFARIIQTCETMESPTPLDKTDMKAFTRALPSLYIL